MVFNLFMRYPFLFLPLITLTVCQAQIKAIIELDTPLTPGESQIWSPLFKATWDKLHEQVNQPILRVEPPNATIDYLEKFTLDLPSVMPTKRYETFGGPATAEFLDKTLATIKGKYDIIINKGLFTLNNKGRLAIGAMHVKLDFPKVFYTSKKGTLDFTLSNGKIHKTPYFGTLGKHNEHFSSQVQIYAYDKKADTCVLEISTTREGEKLVFFKPQQALTLKKAITEVTKAREEKETFPSLGNKDKLKIPYISFDNYTDFSDLLQGEIFYENHSDSFSMRAAFQQTSFQLTEKGARIKVVASVSDIFGGSISQPKPRDFIFDRSFYVFAWKDGAKYPYFALWVDDAAIFNKETP